MNILPRLLHFFQNLPVEVSGKDFKEWDKIISRFLWQGSRPRIRYRTLQVSKERGGLALPCLKTYYCAAQLRVLLNLCNPKYSAKWKEIEESTIEGILIQAIICDGKIGCSSKQKLNPWLEVSIKIWFEIVKKYDLTNQSRFLRWIAYDTDFTPNKIDYCFKLWENGPKMLWEVMKNHSVLSFQEMKERFLLKNQDFHRYLQLRHYLEQEIKKVNLDSGWSGIIRIIMEAFRSQI